MFGAVPFQFQQELTLALLHEYPPDLGRLLGPEGRNVRVQKVAETQARRLLAANDGPCHLWAKEGEVESQPDVAAVSTALSPSLSASE